MSAQPSAEASKIGPEQFKLTPKTITLTIVVMLATIMQALDTTIANVALPHMQGAMSAAQDQITWVLTSYVVTAAIFTSLTGFMVTRFGRTRVFTISIVGFTVASMMCGAAQSLEQIVIFRMIQGALGAGLVPLSQAVLMDVYPKERHGVAMAVWGMGVMLGPIAGPTLGGWLTEEYSWRWVFYINLPFGILASLGVFMLLPDTKRDPKYRFDLLGFILIGTAVGALQLMLDRGTTLDWFSSREIVIETVLAVLAAYMFIVHIFTAEQPFLSPTPFRDSNYVIGLMLAFVVGIALYATMALMPELLQGLLDYPVTTTGMLLMPRGIGTFIAMATVGRLVRTVDARILILIGFAATGVSSWWMGGFNLDVDQTAIALTGLLQGFGMGLVFVPMMTATFSTLNVRFRTESAALYTLVRNVGSSIGISMVATIVTRATQINHAELTEHVTPYSPALQAMASGPMSALDPLGQIMALDGEITRQAAMIAYIDIFKLMTYLMLFTAPLVLFYRTGKKKAELPPEHMAVEA